jgi:hypothetical protein
MGDERKRRRESSREPPGYDPDTFDWEVRAHGLCPAPHSPARPRSAPPPRNSTLIASSQSTDRTVPSHSVSLTHRRTTRLSRACSTPRAMRTRADAPRSGN